jgi:osmotically-inducible protein OsmY
MRKPTLRLDLIESVAALFSLNRPLSAPRPHDYIEATARKSYVFKSFLKGDDIHMLYEHGVVTLTGTVTDESHKVLARETVASLPGVQQVEIRLKEHGQIPEQHSDARLVSRVKSILWFHQNIDADAIEISARDSTVTLRGVAASAAQKKLICKYARDVQGVRKVINEISVLTTTPKADHKPMAWTPMAVGEAIDDASITALVKTTLLYHHSTSALDIGVETKDGVVKLEGKARNWPEKYLITQLVIDVHGVKMVFNNMTVERTVFHDQ